MTKSKRPAPRYASRYESLRPFLRFLAWGCWHSSEYPKVSGKSERTYQDCLLRASAFLPDKAIRKKSQGHKHYITLRSDAYYGCNNYLVNSYRMKALPPQATFYTVFVLQVLGNAVNPLSLLQIQNHDAAVHGVYPSTLEEGMLEDSPLHEVLKSLKNNGYVEMIRKDGTAKYRLADNPLKDLTAREREMLLAAVGFYKNITAVSVIGYQIEAILQTLYRLPAPDDVPAQFRNIAFDRVLDDEILHAALDALRLKKALSFRYKKRNHDKAENVLVFPLRVVTDFSSGGRQYLEGREQGTPFVFSYRLDRITDIRLVKAAPPDEPPVQEPPVRFVVRFRLTDGDREALRARILERSPHVSVLAEEEDSLLCAFEDADPLRFLPWLRGFLPRAEILEGPDGLREHIREHIKEALKNYGCPVQ